MEGEEAGEGTFGPESRVVERHERAADEGHGSGEVVELPHGVSPVLSDLKTSDLLSPSAEGSLRPHTPPDCARDVSAPRSDLGEPHVGRRSHMPKAVAMVAPSVRMAAGFNVERTPGMIVVLS